MKLLSKLLVSHLVALLALTATAPCFAAAQIDQVNVRLAQIENELNTESKQNPAMLQEISKIIQTNPNNGKAHFLAGRVLQRFGFSALATQEFDKADKLMPQTADSMLEAFLLKLEQGEPAAAGDYIAYIAKRFPDDPSLALTRALLMEAKGEKALSEAFISKAMKGRDVRVGVSTAVGQIRLRQGDLPEALACAKFDIAKNPNYLRARVLAGEACTKMKRYREGAEYYKKAYEANAVPDDQINNYATCLFRTEQYAQALDPSLMFLAMATKPDVMRKAKYQLYSLIRHTSEQQVDAAIASVDKKLDHTIYQGRLQLALGDVFDTLGKRAKAEGFFQTGIDQMPAMARPYYRLARDYERDGNYEKAKELYQKAFSLDPNDFDIQCGYVRFGSRYVNRKNDIAWQLKDLVQRR